MPQSWVCGWPGFHLPRWSHGRRRRGPERQVREVSEHWSPKVVARLNDYEVKLVRIEGEFVWHSHQDTDELFLVLAGELTIQLRDRSVTLGPGQLYVVPRGVEHCPRADGEVKAMLLEPAGVINTGDASGDLTATVTEV
ncbi:MAG TPA: cupin domain-containing protein [Candidatus Ruania gallistercoris]|uniref:Cupin domain-containing protein n=1 Tax=Candidatus Ruania gallistercoris TaxID=2838746 RepID=A0A9D2EEU8_9MICO|nr:cupin domain-containing protein [Candidatus Ruania gallistercoris]